MVGRSFLGRWGFRGRAAEPVHPPSADPPPSCPPFASGAARSRRGAGVRARPAERVAAAAAPRTAADLAWEPAPPRQTAAQRSAGGKRSPRAPARCPAAGLPGLEPGGDRRDGPQDGQGQHRPHVRQEPAGPGARHPQPQRGRGEPGAPRGPKTDPDPDSGLQLVPEALLPTPALPACHPGRPTPVFSPSLSLPPRAEDGPGRDQSRGSQDFPYLLCVSDPLGALPLGGPPVVSVYPLGVGRPPPSFPQVSAEETWKGPRSSPGLWTPGWGPSSPRAAPASARPGRCLEPGPESGLGSWARVPGKVGPPLLGREGDSGIPD